MQINPINMTFSLQKSMPAAGKILGVIIASFILLAWPFNGGSSQILNAEQAVWKFPHPGEAKPMQPLGQIKWVDLAQPAGTGSSVLNSPSRAGQEKTYVSISASGCGKKFFSFSRFPAKRGDTVFSITNKAASKAGVAIDHHGFGPTAYVAGIGGLREFDKGPTSGWLYRVNGKYPGIGCGLYKIKGGERVEWVYTTEPFSGAGR